MEDVQENFAEDLKSVNFQVALEVFKKEEIILQGKKENFDLYLIERLFPVLVEGLERLSREVEAHSEKPEEVRARFNPCIFLSQYLMRNNPQHNPEKKELTQYKQIYEYVKQEKFKRHFENNKQGMLKFFMVATKKDSTVCDAPQMRLFYKSVDDQLQLKGQLVEFVQSHRGLQKLRTNISFDLILKELTKFCSITPSVQLSSFDALLKK